MELTPRSLEKSSRVNSIPYLMIWRLLRKPTLSKWPDNEMAQ